MSKAYRITEWVRQFEVDKKKHATKLYEPPPDISNLRILPLPYIRLAGGGHSQSTIDRRINQNAWRQGQLREMAVHGVYIKLLLLAAIQQREFRGWILDERQRPMHAKEIAETLGICEVRELEEILSILCSPEIGLLELCEYRQTSGCEYRQVPGQVRTCPDKSGLFKNETETEKKRNLNETKGVPESGQNCEIVENSSEIVENSVSASDIQSDVSASEFPAEEKVEAVRSDTAGFLCEILQPSPSNPGDITTFRDILDQLKGRVNEGLCTIEIFDAVVEVARVCRREGENPIAMFVKAMKEKRFGYVPERRPRIISNKY